MTQSYFEAYAYKRFKNADVIFTKSVTMDDDNLERPINSYVNVKPSILQPDSGSKVIDAMKDAKSSVYFKADVAFPTGSLDDLGVIDWASVNLERDNEKGLSSDIKTLVNHDNLSAYGKSEMFLEQADINGRDRIIKTGNSKSYPVISAIENRNVIDVSDAINKTFDGSAENSVGALDFAKVNRDWYAFTAGDRLINDFDENSKLEIAKVSDLDRSVQKALRPLQKASELKSGAKAVIAHQEIVKGAIVPAYETNEPVVDYADDMRLMFTDALAPNGKPADIAKTVLETAKAEAETARFKSMTKQMSAYDIEF